MTGLRVDITVPPDLRAMVRNCGDKAGLGRVIARAMDLENEKTVTLIRGKLEGTLLRRRTGRLANSINATDTLVVADGAGGQVRSSVGSNVRYGGEAVPYAAPLEFGSRPHVIVPKNKKALAFAIGGKILVRRKVNHPGNKAYSYVRGTVEERVRNYSRSIGSAAFGFLSGK